MTGNQQLTDEPEQPDGRPSRRTTETTDDGATTAGRATERSPPERSPPERSATEGSATGGATRPLPSGKRGVPTVDASVPATLASPRSKLVYLYLRTTGGGSARDVADDLGMRLVATYPVLDALAGRGLVVRDGETFRCA